MESTDIQRRVIDVACGVFARKGYKSTTIRDVCNEAECNVAAISYYFRGKAFLYKTCCKYALRERLENLPEENPEAILVYLLEMQSTDNIVLNELREPTAGIKAAEPFTAKVCEALQMHSIPKAKAVRLIAQALALPYSDVAKYTGDTSADSPSDVAKGLLAAFGGVTNG